jgi:pheromone shutdown-related protein TraB
MTDAQPKDALEIPKATIKIIGTSHIAKKSAEEIEKAIDSYQPDIVAVELDRRRLKALLDRAAGAKDEKLPLSMIRQVGVTGYIFASVGKAAQQKMGSIMNVNPGVDMLAAVNAARKHKKELHLVDQDIMITMKRLSAKFTFREKIRVVWDIVAAPFQKEKYKIRLDKVPDEKTINKLMGLLKERYPSLYEVIVLERNIVMARNLDAIVRRNPGKKILLVIGAGHGDDLRQRLKQMERIATIV